MVWKALELREVLEKYGAERGDVPPSIDRVIYRLAKLSVRVANAYRLVDEENIRMLVPRIWVECRVIGTRYPAWAFDRANH